jgi:hypothetical protein
LNIIVASIINNDKKRSYILSYHDNISKFTQLQSKYRIKQYDIPFNKSIKLIEYIPVDSGYNKFFLFKSTNTIYPVRLNGEILFTFKHKRAVYVLASIYRPNSGWGGRELYKIEDNSIEVVAKDFTFSN